MNARIQELAKLAQARAEWMTPQGLEWFDNFKQQFAELIVRECRDIVAKTRDQAIERGWNINEAMCTAMYDIDEQFGRLK